MRTALLALLLAVTTACGSTMPAGQTAATPTPIDSSTASSSPSPQPAATPTTITNSPPASTPSPPTRAPLSFTCDPGFASGHNLVIATVRGEPGVYIRDIQDFAQPRNVCKIDLEPDSAAFLALRPTFADGGSVAYLWGDRLLRRDLATGATTTVLSGADLLRYSYTSDGKALTYLLWPPPPRSSGGNVGVEWHLVRDGKDVLLETFRTIGGHGGARGVEFVHLGFSGDGKYVFAGGAEFQIGSPSVFGPAQVRSATDGSLAYSTTNLTTAVWAGTPGGLYLGSQNSEIRWDPSSGAAPTSDLVGYLQPRASPNGGLVAAWKVEDPAVLAISRVHADTESKHLLRRGEPVFLNDDLLWYREELPCALMDCGQAPGTFIYELATGVESASKLTNVYEVWPRSSRSAG